MNAKKAEYLREFEKFLDLVLETHDVVRSIGKLGPRTDGGHLINENTLVRIDEELAGIGERVGESVKDWLSRSDATGYDAYVTMHVYRNSIVHHGGTLNEQFEGGSTTQCPHGYDVRKQRDWSAYKPSYQAFCKSVGKGAAPLKPGDQLMLSVSQPDFLLKLVNGVRQFARALLGAGAVPLESEDRTTRAPTQHADTHVNTAAFGWKPRSRGSGG